LTTEDGVTGADAKAALERGRPVVVLCPPAPARAALIWDLLGPFQDAGAAAGRTPPVLVVAPDDAAAAEWLGAAPAAVRLHAITGLRRSAERLKLGGVQVLCGAPKDIAALVERAALKLGEVVSVVVAWPEAVVAGEHAATLDTLLSEARPARRLVLSWNPAPLADFLERHARRALVVGTPLVDDTGAPLPLLGRVRFCVVAPEGRAVAARDVLDALNATSPLVWDGGPIPTIASPPAAGIPDAVVCTVLPTRPELAALVRLGEPIVLLSAAQLPYLRSLATLVPFAFPRALDRARDRAEELRERVARVLAARGVDAELALLDPLFERIEPAEVAGALLALLGEAETGRREGAPPSPPEAARVRVFVGVGKRDRATPKDLVGALIRAAGVAKEEIGRVDLRDTFSLVELAAAAADRAVRGLTGTTIRGRRVVARLDRDR
jgi:DbpA RNA binding domain